MRVWPERLLSHPVWIGLAALASGGVTAFAFAPFDLYPLALIGPWVALLLWERLGRWAAFVTGWLYTMGLLSVGGYWLYLAPQQLAHIDSPLAEILTALVVAVMSLSMGVSGMLYVSLRNHYSHPGRAVLLLPAVWVLAEWWRGWFMPGFPWFSLGYSQVDTPLAGWAPLFGAYGLSLVVALSAGLLAWLFKMRRRPRAVAVVLLCGLWGGGGLLRDIAWTQPAAPALRVALVQAHQWNEGLMDTKRWASTVQITTALLRDHDLVVWPEAIDSLFQVPFDEETPNSFVAAGRVLKKTLWRKRASILDGQRYVFAVAIHQEERFIEPIERLAQALHKTVILGVTLVDNQRDLRFNSLLVLGGPVRTVYDKRHLLPFGEVIPLRDTLAPLWDWLEVHESTYDGSRTRSNRVPVGEYQAGVSICYESAFGREIAEALPSAHFLIMSSNDHMFQGTTELAQHQQVVRLRALETGRWVARVTRTGLTAITDPKGRVTAALPVDAYGVLSGTVIPMSGVTPFVAWGNRPVISFALLVLSWPALRRLFGRMVKI